MSGIILAIIKSPNLQSAILKVKDLLPGNIIFTEKLEEYYQLIQRQHIGLLLLEDEVIRQEKEESRMHLFNIDCARIVISNVNKQFFAFPVPNFCHLGKESSIVLDDLLILMNDYFREKPKTSIFTEGQDLDFISRNAKMLALFEDAKRISAINSNVLILGESGTGKDILARVIHGFSQRRTKKLLKLNCAAIPQELLESELFGAKKGAYTHAYEDKIGKIQMANGSTLFLDEIAELSLTLQAKLLRVIESGEVDMLGSEYPVKVDVRVISATNKNLEEAVSNGQFRNDLYYRLNVTRLHLPPLRERPDDIPLLINYFISVFNKQYNKEINEIKRDLLKEVYSYHWPGNVRELRNFVERLVVRCKTKILDPELIREEMNVLIQSGKNMLVISGLEEKLAAEERKIIVYHLYKNNFKILKTAKDLNISRQSLFRKMKKYRINSDSLKNDS